MRSVLKPNRHLQVFRAKLLHMLTDLTRGRGAWLHTVFGCEVGTVAQSWRWVIQDFGFFSVFL